MNVKEIKKALEKDIDLSAEDYKAKFELADKMTEGKPLKVSEATRHKRMQANFYGMALNLGMSLQAEEVTQSQLLEAIYDKLCEIEAKIGDSEKCQN